MNFQHLDFLIYSSHKTSTQSLISILRNNKYNTIHCHKLLDLSISIPKNLISNDLFIKELKRYKEINNKKLKIISIIRNPIKRLISSFFQSCHTDEIHINKKNELNTTIMTNNIDELILNYNNKIQNNCIAGGVESLDEISTIFNIKLIKKLRKQQKKTKTTKTYYYFNHDLFELFVLDYNKLIDINNLNYLNNILNINCIINSKSNLSENKIYYDKYNETKKNILNETNNLNKLIKSRYHPFYFTSFN